VLKNKHSTVERFRIKKGGRLPCKKGSLFYKYSPVADRKLINNCCLLPIEPGLWKKLGPEWSYLLFIHYTLLCSFIFTNIETYHIYLQKKTSKNTFYLTNTNFRSYTLIVSKTRTYISCFIDMNIVRRSFIWQNKFLKYLH